MLLETKKRPPGCWGPPLGVGIEWVSLGAVGVGLAAPALSVVPGLEVDDTSIEIDVAVVVGSVGSTREVGAVEDGHRIHRHVDVDELTVTEVFLVGLDELNVTVLVQAAVLDGDADGSFVVPVELEGLAVVVVLDLPGLLNGGVAVDLDGGGVDGATSVGERVLAGTVVHVAELGRDRALVDDEGRVQRLVGGHVRPGLEVGRGVAIGGVDDVGAGAIGGAGVGVVGSVTAHEGDDGQQAEREVAHGGLPGLLRFLRMRAEKYWVWDPDRCGQDLSACVLGHSPC